MRQDGVGANASVFEKGTRVTGRQPGAPKLEHAHGEMVERSLFRAKRINHCNDFVAERDDILWFRCVVGA
jgi:hypothetical protein